MVTDLEARFVQALLDRLDPHLDEPCNVPGCVHIHDHTHVSEDVMCAAA